MKITPPKWAEALVGLLIPPASRDDVLGDLHERYAGPRQYLFDAVCTVPWVIVSKIRRTTTPRMFLMEGLVLFLSFLAAARYRDSIILTDGRGLWWLAISTAIGMAALVLADAYARVSQRWALASIRGAVLGVGFTVLFQVILSTVNGNLAIPAWISFAGGTTGVVLLSIVRMLFPPVTDRPKES